MVKVLNCCCLAPDRVCPEVAIDYRIKHSHTHCCLWSHTQLCTAVWTGLQAHRVCVCAQLLVSVLLMLVLALAYDVRSF